MQSGFINLRPLFCFSTIYLSVMRVYIAILLVICFFSCNRSAQKQSATVGSKADTAAHKMPDSLKNNIIRAIKLDVKSGFFSAEETLDNVKEVFGKDSLDEQWIISRINRTYAQAFNAQVLWPQVTAFDRLAKAFDKLNQNHIIALHNQGMTKEDGVNDCAELHNKLKKKGIRTRGYCFYHRQDLDRVIDDKTLYLAFGDFDHNDRKRVAIGKAIVKVLKEQGFKVNWNNSSNSRIAIEDLTWRKRFGNGNCSYSRAVKILSRG